MWYAIRIYKFELYEKNQDKEFIKMGSTFFNEAIYEYAEKYRTNPEYWKEKLEEYHE